MRDAKDDRTHVLVIFTLGMGCAQVDDPSPQVDASVYIQSLNITLIPTDADRDAVTKKFGTLIDPNATNSKTETIHRFMRNVDILSGTGAAQKVLDGAGITAGDIQSLDPDSMTRLTERFENRYLSAIKEAAGDTQGGFADVYGRCVDDTGAGSTGGEGPFRTDGSPKDDFRSTLGSDGGYGGNPFEQWFGQWLPEGLRGQDTSAARHLAEADTVLKDTNAG